MEKADGETVGILALRGCLNTPVLALPVRFIPLLLAIWLYTKLPSLREPDCSVLLKDMNQAQQSVPRARD